MAKNWQQGAFHGPDLLSYHFSHIIKDQNPKPLQNRRLSKKPLLLSAPFSPAYSLWLLSPYFHLYYKYEIFLKSQLL
jgi:hypothetical protein